MPDCLVITAFHAALAGPPGVARSSVDETQTVQLQKLRDAGEEQGVRVDGTDADFIADALSGTEALPVGDQLGRIADWHTLQPTRWVIPAPPVELAERSASPLQPEPLIGRTAKRRIVVKASIGIQRRAIFIQLL